MKIRRFEDSVITYRDARICTSEFITILSGGMIENTNCEVAIAAEENDTNGEQTKVYDCVVEQHMLYTMTSSTGKLDGTIFRSIPNEYH